MSDQSIKQSFEALSRRINGNIVLLWSRDEEPGHDGIVPLAATSTIRSTSIKREKRIASDVAFLIADSDGSDDVRAVGIEESIDAQGMTWRLASNTKGCGSLVPRLKPIIELLEFAASRKKQMTSQSSEARAVRTSEVHRWQTKRRADLTDILFERIVEFDFGRVLQRLRSAHAPRSQKSGRRGLLFVLQEKIEHPSIISSLSVTDQTLKNARNESNTLQSMFTSFEQLGARDAHSSIGRALIMDIIKKTSRFILQYPLDAIFSGPNIFGPDLKKQLPENLKKLCRYLTISHSLINSACKYTIFRQISVAVIACPVTQYAMDPVPSLDEALKNCGLNLRKSARAQAARKFSTHFKSSREHAKVHAEMQLLAFYETNANIIKPRIICATKKACYLCHLFMVIHGKFLVPSTHGTLYPGWILPEPDGPGASTFLSVVKRFDIAIKMRARQACLKAPPVRTHPAQSEVGGSSLGSITSTVIQEGPSGTQIITANSTARSSIASLRLRKESKQLLGSGQSTPASNTRGSLRIPSKLSKEVTNLNKSVSSDASDTEHGDGENRPPSSQASSVARDPIEGSHIAEDSSANSELSDEGDDSSVEYDGSRSNGMPSHDGPSHQSSSRLSSLGSHRSLISRGNPLHFILKPPDFSAWCRISPILDLLVCYDRPMLRSGEEKFADPVPISVTVQQHNLSPSMSESIHPCTLVAEMTPGTELTEKVVAISSSKRMVRLQNESMVVEVLFDLGAPIAGPSKQ